ncbi:helix-turn-helix domain-containing protein [Niabella beijingensis]|uniref:helix-turn-helix domain-containing protein n=1 Tax=Niabella beijingensis TaxID=2872700 RepID=UPI001CBB2DAD|nr:AraC family transcriptional regulator [Niabella beijingensis]MBZ4189413.1 AraC family transcriptional regulator [Niabella beijingensis]
MNKYKLVKFADLQVYTKGSDIACELITGPHQMSIFEIHDFLLLLFIEQGDGIHQINGEKINLAPFQIHMVFPGQSHKWNFETPCKIHKLVIGTSALQNVIVGLEFANIGADYNSSEQLNEEYFFRLLGEFKSVQTELQVRPIVSGLIELRCRIVLQLLKALNRAAFDNLSQRPRPAIIYNFQLLVESNLYRQTPVAFYAKELGVSANYLSILCNKVLKTSALAFIHHRRLVKAKQLLQENDVPIKEIAYELGFNEYSHFSTFFKTKTGISPKQYKDSLCAKNRYDGECW